MNLSLIHIYVRGQVIGMAGISHDLQEAHARHPAWQRLAIVDDHIRRHYHRPVSYTHLVSKGVWRFDEHQRLGWLPPADGTLFALGLNYADHASELEFKPPTEPLEFIKAPNTFIGHQQQSVRPDNVEYMHYEAELVVVIGKTARRVSEAEAMDYVAGYTAVSYTHLARNVPA